MNLRIAEFDGINHTPAILLGYQCSVELIEKGWLIPALTLGYDHNCIVAYDGDRPIGTIVWNELKHDKSIFVVLGYVVPGVRNCGVYAAMWAALVKKAQDIKVLAIRSATHVDNQPMRRTSLALGRKEDVVQMVFEVPK